MNIDLIVFILISICLAYISRASLRAPRSHGFFRFFAWECILALLLLNIREWFRDPFTVLHIVSWTLLVISAYLVIEAIYQLRRFGQLNQQREDVPLVGIEKTTSLVTNGIYHYIRHPMYSSLLFLAWGIFFKDVSWWAIILALAATGFLYLTARRDEQESLRYFGPAYLDYQRRTRMFVPFIF